MPRPSTAASGSRSAPALPGFDVTELYPKQAKIADKFSIVRSLHHDTGDHFAGGHRMLTTKDMGVSGANPQGKFPGIGAIVAKEVGARQHGMPGYVGLPNVHSIGLTPGYLRRLVPRGAVQPAPGRRSEPAQLLRPRPEPRLGPHDARGWRTARRCSAISTWRASTSTAWPRRRRWTASRRRPTSSSPGRRRGVRSTSTKKIRGCAIITAAMPGDNRRCWPGGWSRRVRRS